MKKMKKNEPRKHTEGDWIWADKSFCSCSEYNCAFCSLWQKEDEDACFTNFGYKEIKAIYEKRRTRFHRK